jgi:ferrous iron transport protein B
MLFSAWQKAPLDRPARCLLTQCPFSRRSGAARRLLGRQTGTKRPDRVVCIVDASNLERHLYLVTQVLELGLPTILVLNMIDVAAERHQIINSALLNERLGIPVIAMQATTGVGLTDLKLALSREDLPLPKWTAPPLPDAVTQELEAARADLAASGAIRDQASLLGAALLTF